MADDRPIVYREGQNTIFRASGFGCLRAQVASALEYEPAPAKYQSDILDLAAAEGDLHEGAVVDNLQEQGYRIVSTQDEIELRIIPRVYVRGHTDGLVIPPKARNERLLEVKSMSKERFRKWERSGDDVLERLLSDEWNRYAWQISNYMHAHPELDVIYVAKNRDSGKLLIEKLGRPPIDLKQIKRRVIEVEKWRVRGELPPCSVTGGERFFCAYPYLHEDQAVFGDEPDEDPPLDDATTALLAGLAEQYTDLSSQISRLQALKEERDGVRDKIMELNGWTEGEGTKKIKAGQYTVTRVDQNRTRWNAAKLGEDLGITIAELEDQYKIPYQIHYPLVKRAKNADTDD